MAKHRKTPIEAVAYLRTSSSTNAGPDKDSDKRQRAAIAAFAKAHAFRKRFLDRLENAYHEFRDNTEGDVIQELELLNWTREYLTGFNTIKGQGKPFLAD